MDNKKMLMIPIDEIERIVIEPKAYHEGIARRYIIEIEGNSSSVLEQIARFVEPEKSMTIKTTG